MDEATEHVRAFARRVVAAALELGPLRAALLAGSGARGDADFYSDVDLLLYVDELPPDDRLERLQEALGGTDLVPIAPPHLVQFHVGGVAVQVGYTTLTQIEEELETALVRLEEVIGSPNQKMLSGLLEGLPLYGEEVLAALARARRGVSGRASGCVDRAPLAASSRSGTTTTPWRCATPSSGGSTCCSRRRSTCSGCSRR